MKKIKRLFLTSVLLYLLIFIVSCDARPYSSKSSGYFKYKIDVDTKEVVLVGLTEKGEEQETLVIPLKMLFYLQQLLILVKMHLLDV